MSIEENFGKSIGGESIDKIRTRRAEELKKILEEKSKEADELYAKYAKKDTENAGPSTERSEEIPEAEKGE